MARCFLLYDDGSHVSFNEPADAVYHLMRQGSAGLRGLFAEESGDELTVRDVLEDMVARGKEHDDGTPAVLAYLKEFFHG